jgi:hypothetical protein
MGICCAFIRLSDRNIEAMIRQPNLVYSFLGMQVESLGPIERFIVRMFRRTASSQQDKLEVLPDSRSEDDESDVDKAWHAIHFLLTGTAEPTDNLLGFLCSGGTSIKDTDVGFGPPRTYTSTQVAAIFAELTALDRDKLHSRYKPKEMDEQDVYSPHWEEDGEEGFEYVWGHFERLLSLLADAQRCKQGLFIYQC